MVNRQVSVMIVGPIFKKNGVLCRAIMIHRNIKVYDTEPTMR